MDTTVSYHGNGWMSGTEGTGSYPDRTMTDKEWKAYLKKIDEVEAEIRKEIQAEGEQNLAQADAARAKRRENWQENWEEIAELAKSNWKKVLKSDQSDHELLVQEEMQDDNWVPYEQYRKGNTIVYNGVVFGCDPEHHAISLGDVRDTRNVIHIPLADGGVLLVNRNEIGSLARAIGMFSAEDVGRILRAIEEDKQIQRNQFMIEEEENRTMEHLVSDSGKETEKAKED